MTGITKDELMQMARDAGISIVHSEHTIICDASELIALINAILERAAVECEKVNDRIGGSVGAVDSADSIRALKINTGDRDEQAD